jgi:hypothetical protein
VVESHVEAVCVDVAEKKTKKKTKDAVEAVADVANGKYFITA